MNNYPDISNIWKTLSGENNWEGLLKPLDIDLRRFLIRYGEFCQTTYDTFNSSKYSKYAGTSIFSKKDFFSKMGLTKGNPYKYRVTKFIYATSGINVPEEFIIKSLSREAWCKESNFIGYVAVAEDESVAVLGRREIVVAWRGSIQSLEWLNDFQFSKVPAHDIFGDPHHGDDQPQVHQGWYSIYTSDDPKSPFNKTSARMQVFAEIKNLMEQYKNEDISITITGHSMGATLATLNAVDIVANNVNNTSKSCLVTAILYASPQVGDYNFKKMCSKYDNLRILRICNFLDVVLLYPLIGYKHVGQELTVKTIMSPYLKFPGNFWSWHNVEAYMHGIAGYQGDGEFELVVHRDIALINKHWDHLRPEYLIPPGWWNLKNKGMIQHLDGSWRLEDHEIDEDK
ncbi:phospholipase A1-IIgamma-like [Amaranthus tricolor]|uniref:phospholipase A1-IIgamma-like n=1 Tax=Amaranthus tricolor TaxID=29722 RepID=UPI0025882F95|nr:phospholipase A1-IIgamma-like [Amaranthus tricolor]